MSLLNSASLCVTPNGYKAGTLYSVIPNTSLGDMTVVRATTATRVNSAGLIESVANNVPRLDYSNGTCPSLLVEPQRTNLITYSQDFSNASWSKYDVTANLSSVISPSGNQNSYVIAETNTTAVFAFDSNVITFSANTAYTLSVYAKWDAACTRNVHLRIGNCPSVNLGASFDKNGNFVNYTGGSNGTLNSYSSEDMGNGWWKFIVTITTANVSSAGDCLAVYYLNGTSLNYAGSTTQKINWWGAQLEAGSYPTSYIPTTSAAVTRNADAISKTGISSLIGQTEGVMFTDFVCVNNSSYCDVMSIGTDGTTGVMELQINGAASNTLRATYFYGGFVANIPALATLTIGQRYKAAFAYKSNDFVFYLNGVQQGTDTSGTVVSGMSEVSLNGYNSSTANKENALINSAILFPTRLTNAELASLTTI